MTIKLNKYGTSLGTRRMAEPIRKEIISNLNEKHIIDCDKVEVISSSFADELFGIIIKDYGYDVFKKIIQFKNTNDEAKKTIKNVIIRRLKMEQQ